MCERRFSKVTKWEIALGAAASLMTGVVVGLVYREKRKKKKVPPCPMPHRPSSVPHEKENGTYYGTVEEKHVLERDRRRPPRNTHGERKERYRTPHELGGRPHTRVSARYQDTNRYTGNRHK